MSCRPRTRTGQKGRGECKWSQRKTPTMPWVSRMIRKKLANLKYLFRWKFRQEEAKEKIEDGLNRDLAIRRGCSLVHESKFWQRYLRGDGAYERVGTGLIKVNRIPNFLVKWRIYGTHKFPRCTRPRSTLSPKRALKCSTLIRYKAKNWG